MLYQLSYSSASQTSVTADRFGPENVTVRRLARPERETGFEPATFCLEGKSSTVELLPQFDFGMANAECGIKTAIIMTSVFIPNSEFPIPNWVERDSNPRIPKEPDLQSGAFDHSATYP